MFTLSSITYKLHDNDWRLVFLSVATRMNSTVQYEEAMEGPYQVHNRMIT